MKGMGVSPLGGGRFFEGHGVAFVALFAHVLRFHSLPQATSHRP